MQCGLVISITSCISEDFPAGGHTCELTQGSGLSRGNTFQPGIEVGQARRPYQTVKREILPKTWQPDKGCVLKSTQTTTVTSISPNSPLSNLNHVYALVVLLFLFTQTG